MKIRVRQYDDNKKLVSDTGFKKVKFRKLKDNNMVTDLGIPTPNKDKKYIDGVKSTGGMKIIEGKYNGIFKIGGRYVIETGESIIITQFIDRYSPEDTEVLFLLNGSKAKLKISQLAEIVKYELTGGTLNAEVTHEDATPNPINPSHYKLSGGRKAIDIIQEILTPEQFIGFLRGNIFKYDIRYKQKGGVEDLKKSAWYKEKLIEVESGNV